MTYRELLEIGATLELGAYVLGVLACRLDGFGRGGFRQRQEDMREVVFHIASLRIVLEEVRDLGFVDVDLVVDFAIEQLANDELRPHLGGMRSAFDRAFGGLTLGGGYRPTPWLRLPDLRVSAGYADFDGEGEKLMLVHGQISPGLIAAFNERLERVAQDFAQQHLADQRLPAEQRRPYTLLVAVRSWLFGPFAELRREAPPPALKPRVVRG